MKKTKMDELPKLAIHPNAYPDRNYEVTLESEEWVSICPSTKKPNFATLRISYVPNKLLIEQKSLKLFITSFKDKVVSQESAPAIIFDIIQKICRPRELKVKMIWNTRGGIETVAEVMSKYYRELQEMATHCPYITRLTRKHH